MAKIKQLKELPDWFDLRKYESCQCFRAIDWLTNLSRRKLIFEYLADSDLTSVSDLARAIREDPVQENSFYDTPSSPVRPLRFADVASRAGFVLSFEAIPSVAKEAERWKKLRAAISPSGWLESATDRALDGYIGPDLTGNFPLLVDLSASDSMLIESFTAWLKDARSQLDINTTRERPAYRHWARYGLLPYLDLLIWSEENRHQIAHNVMRQAVGYPHDNDAFRKTVPPLAKSLMKSLQHLEALAAVESASEKPRA